MVYRVAKGYATPDTYAVGAWLNIGAVLGSGQVLLTFEAAASSQRRASRVAGKRLMVGLSQLQEARR